MLSRYDVDNDVSLTEVGITDKDRTDIAALATYFPKAHHLLSQFHVLKAVDTCLKKLKDEERFNKDM